MLNSPIIDPDMFITQDHEKFLELLSQSTYPIFTPDLARKNKMKTTYLKVNNIEYRVYYKYDSDLEQNVYYFPNCTNYILFELADKTGILCVKDGSKHITYEVIEM